MTHHLLAGNYNVNKLIKLICAISILDIYNLFSKLSNEFKRHLCQYSV